MKKVYYEVYIAGAENQILSSFDGKGAKKKAISFAKMMKGQDVCVDRVVFNEHKGEFEDYQCVWAFDW